MVNERNKMTTYRIHRENQTTAQVVAALTRHPDWRAEAPRVRNDDCSYAETRTVPHGDGSGIPFESLLCDAWNETAMPIRSDWTILRPKRKLVKVGTLTPRYFGLGYSIDTKAIQELDQSKRYELFAREVES